MDLIVNENPKKKRGRKKASTHKKRKPATKAKTNPTPKRRGRTITAKPVKRHYKRKSNPSSANRIVKQLTKAAMIGIGFLGGRYASEKIVNYVPSIAEALPYPDEIVQGGIGFAIDKFGGNFLGHENAENLAIGCYAGALTSIANHHIMPKNDKLVFMPRELKEIGGKKIMIPKGTSPASLEAAKTSYPADPTVVEGIGLIGNDYKDYDLNDLGAETFEPLDGIDDIGDNNDYVVGDLGADDDELGYIGADDDELGDDDDLGDLGADDDELGYLGTDTKIRVA